MSHSQADQVTPREFYLGKTWKVTRVKGTGVGMAKPQTFEFKLKDDCRLQLELPPLLAFGTAPDWNTSFEYHRDDGTLTTDFGREDTVATVHQHDAGIKCHVRRSPGPGGFEEPGEWEAQEEG